MPTATKAKQEIPPDHDYRPNQKQLAATLKKIAANKRITLDELNAWGMKQNPPFYFVYSGLRNLRKRLEISMPKLVQEMIEQAGKEGLAQVNVRLAENETDHLRLDEVLEKLLTSPDPNDWKAAAGIVRERRECRKYAAQELGQWTEKREDSGKIEVIVKREQRIGTTKTD